MGNTWLFQGNPDRFNLDGLFESGRNEFLWLTRQHVSEIEDGDEVFVWRAAGRSDPGKSGVIAKAVVAEPPSRRPDETEAQPLWRSGSDRARVDFRCLLRLCEPFSWKRFLPRRVLMVDAILEGMLVFRQPQGTNFALTTEESGRLNELWGKLPRS
jgi:hypothetical protein